MAMTPFATDDQLAARLRAVAADLRPREPQHATELDEVARILDPEPAREDRADAPTSGRRLFGA